MKQKLLIEFADEPAVAAIQELSEKFGFTVHPVKDASTIDSGFTPGSGDWAAVDRARAALKNSTLDAKQLRAKWDR